MAPPSPKRIERGDWQTPPELARAVVELLRAGGEAPRTVLEPTCGRGAFLVAAAAAWPDARLVGIELDDEHARAARAALGAGAEVRREDAFTLDWGALIEALPEPLLVLGNPPWVTASALGALGSGVRPERRAEPGRSGVEAMTGASNFDVSEWLLRRWLEALVGRRFRLAMLCKLQVARRILRYAEARGWALSGALRRIDASAHFGAQVEAVLLDVRAEGERPAHWNWPVFPSLSAGTAKDVVSVVDGVLCRGAERYRRTARFAGASDPEWRSGLKHDCARVMELRREGGALRARSGERLELEAEGLVHPLLKGSDLANGRLAPTRAVIVPQRSLGEDPAQRLRDAPATRAWLEANGAALDGRRSSIYRGRPRFAIFGVGDYAFAPFKVAIAGLYKRLRFELVGPVQGRPVMLDDTCYFMPFDDEDSARAALSALRSAEASAFFEARVFWDAKRPISKAVLQSLDWRRLAPGYSS